MAYTEADLTARITALETAYARGEQTVQFVDRAVTYKSNAAVWDALNYFKGLLNQLRATTTTTRGKQTYGVATKGF